MKTTTFTTQHQDLLVRQQGEGADVLLIGGFGDSAATWARLAHSLDSEFRVTRYDRTSSRPGPYRLTSLVADALEVLDDGEIDAAHVVGTSLGGVVAQQLAIAHPDRVASLTLASTWAHADRALRALLSTWRWAAEHAHSLGDLLQVAYSSTHSTAAWNSGRVDDAITAAEASQLRAGPNAWRTAREAFIWTSWAAQEHDARGVLGEVHVPSLVISGAEDRVLSPAHARELSALLPGSSQATIPDAGHRAFEDQPEAFQFLLSRFLRAQAREAVAA